MNPPGTADTAKEALRQQMLLRALWQDARPGVVGGWLRDGARLHRGLQAYQANGRALAERALAAVHPTLQQLLGAESFAALARAFWQAEPPLQGDIAEWGGGLAAFIAAAPQLAEEPYLADVARLEWALHRADRAADGQPPQGLERLADTDPAQLRLRLQPGSAVIVSAHPIVSIWAAHRSNDPDRFAPVREAFAQARGETAWVRRSGWRAVATPLSAEAAAFTQAVLAGQTLGQALGRAGDAFDFEAWLLPLLQQQGLAAVEVAASPSTAPSTPSAP